jgi:hypothetical protein
MNDLDIGISIVLVLMGVLMIVCGWSIHWNFSGQKRSYSSRDASQNKPYQIAALVLAGFGGASLGVVIIKLLRLYVVG